VVLVVGGRQHFGFVDEVNAEFLQRLRLGEMTDAALGHDRNGDRVHDALHEFERGHARHAAHRADIGGNAFERHDGDGAGFLRDDGLLRRDHIHDDAALEHLREPALDGEGTLLGHDLSPKWCLVSLSYQAIPMETLGTLYSRLGGGTLGPGTGVSAGGGTGVILERGCLAASPGASVGSGSWRQTGIAGL
jgi:hypothetical protein